MNIQVLKVKPVLSTNDPDFKAVGDVLLNFGSNDFVLIKDWRIFERSGVISIMAPGLRFRDSNHKGKLKYSKLIALPPHMWKAVEKALVDAYLRTGAPIHEGEVNGTESSKQSAEV